MAANGVQICASLAADNEGVAVWEAAEENQTALVMLNEFDAIAGTTAASEFGGGAEGGMGQDKHACGGWHGFTGGGDQMACVIGDEGREDAGVLEEGGEHEEG